MEAELGRLQTANALLTNVKARKMEILKFINTLSVAGVLKHKEQLSVAESAASGSGFAASQATKLRLAKWL